MPQFEKSNGVMKMTLDVNKELMTIMGVKFQNKKIFDAVSFVIGSSMIENFVPTVEDVEHYKEYAERQWGLV